MSSRGTRIARRTDCAPLTDVAFRHKPLLPYLSLTLGVWFGSSSGPSFLSAERAVHKLRAVPGDVRIEYRTALSNLQLKYIMCLIHVNDRVSLNMMWQKDCFALSWSNLVICYYNLSLEPDLLRYRLSQLKQQVVSPCFIALK